MTESAAEQWPLRRGSLIYPTPVAIACGRVLRARTAAERVNACLKAAEVLTRYLAAVAVGSFASRDDDAEAKLSELSGNLSFGHFLTTVQEVAGAKGDHPAGSLLAQGFKATKRNKETLRGKTDGALVSLLELRNELGHELRNLDEAKAAAIEAAKAPRGILVEALEGVEALLSKPLFVVEDQQWTREALVVRRLLLMGESSDPAPQSIKVGHETGGVGETGTPYLAVNRTCLQLPPWLLWGIDQARQNFALLFLDAVEEARARYCTLDGSEQHRSDAIAQSIQHLFSGARRAPDTVVLIDGRNLASEWSETRRYIEESGRRQDGLVDWQAFEPATVKWFAGLLEPGTADAHATIRDRLLDGRYQVEPDEVRQLRLLFGRPATVRSELKRDVLDLRVIDPNTMRPSKRDLVDSANLIEALKRAVQFFAAQTGMGEVAPEDLRQTDGSLDYLTLREIFVNQAVHQDYRDSSAAGQIEIHREKVTVFNTGYSLVPTDKLLDGGKSQSRNPLIARALRLIGFAEISGSGIRAVHRACQQARRRAPTFESDKDANTFALTLDWSEGAVDIDTYWKTLVGVHLTQRQAAVLNAIANAPSVTIAILESSTGLDTDSVVEALDFLVLQVLVEQDESNYRLAHHLREKLG
ncbi:ATP-binding protein [Archangium violaceum]|uniref:ATP-binding protein n=1 Tax=Archangium violaceum TaxID=83451 RepID=UPI002B292FD8|nr:ATP-binding protein [Archangium gephyra]